MGPDRGVMAACSVPRHPARGTGPAGDHRTRPPPARRAGRARPRRPAGRGAAGLRQRDGLPARHGPAAPPALARPRPPSGLARGGLARPDAARCWASPTATRAGRASGGTRRSGAACAAPRSERATDRRLLRAHRAARPARRTGQRTRRGAAARAARRHGPRARACCRPPSTARDRPVARGGSTAAWGSATCCATTGSPATPARSPCSAATCRSPPRHRTGRAAPDRDRRARLAPCRVPTSRSADDTMTPCRPAAASARPGRPPPRARPRADRGAGPAGRAHGAAAAPGYGPRWPCSPTTRVTGEIVVATPETGPDDPGPAISVPEDLAATSRSPRTSRTGYTGSVLRFSELSFDQLGRCSPAAGQPGEQGAVLDAPRGRPGARHRARSTSRASRSTRPTSSSR